MSEREDYISTMVSSTEKTSVLLSKFGSVRLFSVTGCLFILFCWPSRPISQDLPNPHSVKSKTYFGGGVMCVCVCLCVCLSALLQFLHQPSCRLSLGMHHRWSGSMQCCGQGPKPQASVTATDFWHKAQLAVSHFKVCSLNYIKRKRKHLRGTR